VQGSLLADSCKRAEVEVLRSQQGSLLADSCKCAEVEVLRSQQGSLLADSCKRAEVEVLRSQLLQSPTTSSSQGQTHPTHPVLTDTCGSTTDKHPHHIGATNISVQNTDCKDTDSNALKKKNS